MQTITIKIPDESEALNPSQLADFLYLFRAANLALDQIVAKKDRAVLRKPSPAEEKVYRTSLARCSPEKLNRFFDPLTEPDFLQITRIRRHSPMEIDLTGWGYLIIVAVIISGGPISILGGLIKAQLPPLGTGIKHLREAFRLDKTIRAGFGIRSTIIKLSREEYRAFLQVPKGQGGFQNLLLRLQRRVVNKRTRELELSEHDIERICRCKADPRRGGFQARFEKIFGRHFPD